MMGYKDRTFCSLYLAGDCINGNCDRAFTELDRRAATDWWGGEDFPLVIGSMYSEHCNYMPNNGEE